MGTKTVKIKYNGKDEIVQFSDTLTFGDVEDLIGDTIDLSDVTKPKVNLKSYRMNILTKVITKAPFKLNDTTTLELMDRKIVQRILKEVLIVHPLSDYIEEWMETFQPTGNIKN